MKYVINIPEKVNNRIRSYLGHGYAMRDEDVKVIADAIYNGRKELEAFEWCTNCKEYDPEKHCCPRFNKVIRNALKDAQPERKKGKWIITHDGGLNTAVCSECKYMIGHIEGCEYFRFCPSCGARLEVENE